MKRVVAPVLPGLGVVLLLAAALVRFVAGPALAAIPADLAVTSVAAATDATYLDLGSLSIKTGQQLRAVREVRGDAGASDGDTAVLDAVLRVENPADGSEISTVTDRVAVDRRTAHAVQCCGEAVDGEPVPHSGLSYTFPLGTEPKTYQYFDPTVRRAFPIEYRGTERLQGLRAYRFEQEIPERSLGSQLVPGFVVGQRAAPLLSAEQLYATTRTLWVEPTTGAILQGREQQRRVLRTDGAPDTVVFDATLALTAGTVDAAVARAEDGIAQLRLLRVVVPLVLLGLGAAAVAAGAVVLVVRRRSASAAPAAG
jgi:hypothetical protein